MTSPNSDEFSKLKKSLDSVEERLVKVSNDMARTQIADYVDLMNSPLKLMWRNFLGGIARGVGSAIGWAFFATFIIWILQALGALNLPIIGDYIAELVKIVQKQIEY